MDTEFLPNMEVYYTKGAAKVKCIVLESRPSMVRIQTPSGVLDVLPTELEEISWINFDYPETADRSTRHEFGSMLSEIVDAQSDDKAPLIKSRTISGVKQEVKRLRKNLKRALNNEERDLVLRQLHFYEQFLEIKTKRYTKDDMKVLYSDYVTENSESSGPLSI
jgi:hypothetical protein